MKTKMIFELTIERYIRDTDLVADQASRVTKEIESLGLRVTKIKPIDLVHVPTESNEIGEELVKLRDRVSRLEWNTK